MPCLNLQVCDQNEIIQYEYDKIKEAPCRTAKKGSEGCFFSITMKIAPLAHLLVQITDSIVLMQSGLCGFDASLSPAQ